MSNKYILFSIFFSIILSCTQTVLANDYKGLRMTEGSFIIVGTDPSVEDYFFQLLFNEVEIAIDKQGNVTGAGSIQLNDREIKGSIWNGPVNISLEGTYDSANDQFSGNFTLTYQVDMKNEPPKPLVSVYSTSNLNFSGTFTGTSSPDDGSLVLTFTGTKITTGSMENSNGNKESLDKTLSWTNKAVFADFANLGNLTGGLVKGTAQISRNKGESWIQVNKDEPLDVKPYDKIQTGPDTRMLIKYNDGSVFKVKSNTTLTILPDGIQLEAGGTWFNLEKQGKLFKLVTPTTVVGSLGTQYSADYDTASGKSTVRLIEGIISVKTNTDDVLFLKPGDEAMISANEVVSNTFDSQSVLVAEKKELNEDIQVLGLDLNTVTTDESGPDNTNQSNDTSSKASTSNISRYLIVAIVILLTFFVIKIINKRKLH